MHRIAFNKIFLLLMPVLLLLIAGCGDGDTSPTAPGPLGQAVQSHLTLLNDTVTTIIDPATGKPATIPNFQSLYDAAGRLDIRQNPAKDAATIMSLLGRGSDFDTDAPASDYALQFPKDHHLHANMGFEWYYVCFHLNVTDSAGKQGRIGVLLSMQKQSIIGLTTRKRLGWSDPSSMMFVNLVTATVDFPDHKAVIRRSENLQWPAVGGKGRFSTPGENFFFECGSDSLSGTTDVLPLLATVQDGKNLSFSLTLAPPDGFLPINAFFLQGIPSIAGGGTGLTALPTPGIYYSWPQLVVKATPSASIVVDGETYTINSGRGWMDHQLMMHSLRNPDNASSPVPFADDPKPIDGWSWQFFNLENGDAFTGAAFHSWYLNTNPALSYGYYVAANPLSGKWDAYFITGNLVLGDFRSFPVIAGAPTTSASVQFPNSWKYVNVQSIFGNPLAGTATPWYTDGTFNSQSLQVISENPVDYKDTSGKHPNGVGFCESVGFERTDSFQKRALEYLKR
jgi:hypothetical protein